MGYKNPDEAEIFWNEPAPLEWPVFPELEPAPAEVPELEPELVPVPLD